MILFLVALFVYYIFPVLALDYYGDNFLWVDVVENFIQGEKA